MCVLERLLACDLVHVFDVSRRCVWRKIVAAATDDHAVVAGLKRIRSHWLRVADASLRGVAGEGWIIVVKLLRAHGGCLGIRRL